MKKVLLVLSLLLAFAGSGFAEEVKPRIAVISFITSNSPTSNGISFSNLLAHNLYKTGKFIVLERDNIERILQEQKLQLTGCTKTECAVEIGKILNVEYIVVGNMDTVGTNVNIFAKIVNVETSTILKSEMGTCDIDDDFVGISKSIANKLGEVQDDGLGFKVNPNSEVYFTKETTRLCSGLEMYFKGQIIDIGIGGYFQYPHIQMSTFSPVYILANIHTMPSRKDIIGLYLTVNLGYSILDVSNFYMNGVGTDLVYHNPSGGLYYGVGCGIVLFGVLQLNVMYCSSYGFYEVIKSFYSPGYGDLRYEEIQEYAIKIRLGIIFF